LNNRMVSQVRVMNKVFEEITGVKYDIKFSLAGGIQSLPQNPPLSLTNQVKFKKLYDLGDSAQRNRLAGLIAEMTIDQIEKRQDIGKLSDFEKEFINNKVNDFIAAVENFQKQSGSSGITTEEQGVASSASVLGKAQKYGGIDFDPSLLNLQIKRDKKGVPLPLPQQDIQNINIKGLYPIIINIQPIINVPAFLGMGNPAEQGEKLASG